MKKDKTRVTLTRHPNAMVLRRHNKRMRLIERKDKDGFTLDFVRTLLPGETKDSKFVDSRVIRDKVVVSSISLSTEAMEHLVQMYLRYTDTGDCITFTYDPNKTKP